MERGLYGRILDGVGRALDEALAAAYGGPATAGPAGFSYKIVPLSFNLQQRKGGRRVSAEAERSNKYFPGETVQGKSRRDGEQHIGVIQQIHVGDGSVPDIAFVLDMETSRLEPLLYGTLRRTSTKRDGDMSLDYFLTHCNDIEYLNTYYD